MLSPKRYEIIDGGLGQTGKRMQVRDGEQILMQVDFFDHLAAIPSDARLKLVMELVRKLTSYKSRVPTTALESVANTPCQ